MKKILMITGEENAFDNEMTMFKNLNNEYDISYSKMFNSEKKIHKILRNLGPFFIKKELNFKLIKKLKYDTIILFESIVKNYAIKYIRKNNPDIRIIIYFRNQFTFSKKRNISLKFLKKLNCEFWSYHLDDCNNLGFRYNYQFWNTNFKNKVADCDLNEYDCLFLGRIKNRLEDIIQIHNIAENYNLKDYIYLVPKSSYGFDKNIQNKYLDYIQYLRLLVKSKAVIDLVNTENYGLTLRPLEAMFYKKKLITNYVDIDKYDFYNPDNIFILGVDNLDKLQEFINSSFRNIDNRIIDKYNFDNWIENFFR